MQILLISDGVEVDRTATGDDGVYEFTNLPAGTYYIQVVIDPEYTFSPIVEGGNAVDQDGTTDPVALELGKNIDTWNVGMYIPVSLGNKVFNDLNGNAIQDSGEPGIAGVTVTLVNEAGEELATQETASDGSYSLKAYLRDLTRSSLRFLDLTHSLLQIISTWMSLILDHLSSRTTQAA